MLARGGRRLVLRYLAVRSFSATPASYPASDAPSFDINELKPNLKPNWFTRWGRVSPEEEMKKQTFADLAKHFGTNYSTKNPGEHDSSDLGKYYELTPDMMVRLQPVIPKPILAELEFGSNALMVREAGRDLVAHMHPLTTPFQGQARGSRVCIHGNRGCGKSATLLYALQYAHAHSWLVISTTGQEWPNDKLGLIKETKLAPGIFEQALFTQSFFENLRKTQKKTLKKIKLKRSYDYDWEPRLDPPPKMDDDDAAEGVVKEKRLYDMVRLGAIHVQQASEILYDFVDELRLVNELPVVVSVDGINNWEDASPFPTPDGRKKVLGTQLAMVDAFSTLRKDVMANGIFLSALTTVGTLRKAPNFLIEADYTVEVKPYTKTEMNKCLDHYGNAGFLHSKVDDVLTSRVRALTGGVPTDVRKASILL